MREIKFGTKSNFLQLKGMITYQQKKDGELK